MDRYHWILDLKNELDLLQDMRNEYDQVEQIKKIEALWKKMIDPIFTEMTRNENGSYLMQIREEIIEEVFSYISDYIDKNSIPLRGVRFYKRNMNAGKSKMHVLIPRENKRNKYYSNFEKSVSKFDYFVVFEDMVESEYTNKNWATKDMYERFRIAKREKKDWVQSCSHVIVDALNQIKENDSQ